MSQENYNVLKETIYLYSVSNLVESILDADKQDSKKMKKYNPKKMVMYEVISSK